MEVYTTADCNTARPHLELSEATSEVDHICEARHWGSVVNPFTPLFFSLFYHSPPQQSPNMSLDPPAYILSLQNNIRARPISWEGAVRAKTITDADLKKIKAIDKVRKEQRKQTVEAELDTYTTLLLGNGETKSIFEGAAKRTDILQYMLVLTGDLIEGAQA